LTLGLIPALLLKWGKFYKYEIFETLIIGFFAFASYLLAEGLEFSGIVSILFTSVAMAHYAISNLSPQAKKLSVAMAQLVANLADTLVFLYLGMALFAFSDDYNFGTIVFGLLAIFIARASHVLPITAIINLFRKPEKKITNKFKFFIWLAGLRGGIALVLAIELKEFEHELNYSIGHGAPVLFTSTLIIAVITIVIMGGITTPLLEKFKIPVGVDYEVSTQPRDVNKNTFFIRIDKKYLRPFFHRHDPIEVEKGPDEIPLTIAQSETTPST